MYTSTCGLFVSNPPGSNFGRFGGSGGSVSSTDYLTGQQGANIGLNSSIPNSADVNNYTAILAADMSTYTELAQMGIFAFLNLTNSSVLSDNQVIIDNITAAHLGISVGDVIQISTFWGDNSNNANSTLNDTGLTVAGIVGINSVSTLFTAFSPNNLEVGTSSVTTTPYGGFLADRVVLQVDLHRTSSPI